MGGIAVALVSVLSLNQGVGNRLGQSNDAAVTASTFNKDVQSAQEIETTTAPGCGSGTQVVGLQWGLDANGNYQTVVSYVTNNTGQTTSLTRQICAAGASTSPSSSFLVAHDVGTPIVTFNPCGFLASGASWTGTKGLYGIMLNIDKTIDPLHPCNAPTPITNAKYAYTLSGLPSNGPSTGSFSQVFQTPNPAGCNLASPGTGTYANVLCFADFSTFTDPASGCQQFKLPIQNSEDFLQFCMIASPQNTVRPQSIPTYPDASSPQFGYNSEAYLGNNGFYTGIAGKGALSQRPQSGFVARPLRTQSSLSPTFRSSTSSVTRRPVGHLSPETRNRPTPTVGSSSRMPRCPGRSSRIRAIRCGETPATTLLTARSTEPPTQTRGCSSGMAPSHPPRAR